jgi:hypothetical protein
MQHADVADAQLTAAAALSDAVGTGGSAEPVNAELLMMLNEYAGEYSQPELHLHPAQVEQDLEDLTAGTAGVLSPRLASMDWQNHQQQQQQQRHHQQPADTVPAIAHAAQLPAPLFGVAAAGPPHAVLPSDPGAGAEEDSHVVLAHVLQGASS